MDDETADNYANELDIEAVEQLKRPDLTAKIIGVKAASIAKHALVQGIDNQAAKAANAGSRPTASTREVEAPG